MHPSCKRICIGNITYYFKYPLEDFIFTEEWAIIFSVTVVLVFGEIVPQAICIGPQQMKIAYFLAPFTSIIMIILGIAAYPIAQILDLILGGGHVKCRFQNSDLRQLIELHSYNALQQMDIMDIN